MEKINQRFLTRILWGAGAKYAPTAALVVPNRILEPAPFPGKTPTRVFAYWISVDKGVEVGSTPYISKPSLGAFNTLQNISWKIHNKTKALAERFGDLDGFRTDNMVCGEFDRKNLIAAYGYTAETGHYRLGESHLLTHYHPENLGRDVWMGWLQYKWDINKEKQYVRPPKADGFIWYTAAGSWGTSR